MPSHVPEMKRRPDRMTSTPRAQEGGFTLIEVMISVLVLLVGMMGVAGMQILSLQTNQSAYYRSQAVYIGSEILDAMRANPSVAADYVGTYPVDEGVVTIPASPGCATAGVGCTPAEAAQQDIREWTAHFADVFGVGGASFRPTVPGGQAVITVVGNEYNVEVSWLERQFDDDDAGDGSATRSVVRDAINLTTVVTP